MDCTIFKVYSIRNTQKLEQYARIHQRKVYWLGWPYFWYGLLLKLSLITLSTKAGQVQTLRTDKASKFMTSVFSPKSTNDSSRNWQYVDLSIRTKTSFSPQTGTSKNGAESLAMMYWWMTSLIELSTTSIFSRSLGESYRVKDFLVQTHLYSQNLINLSQNCLTGIYWWILKFVVSQ